MKVVIIGAGMAGLTLGAYLQKYQMEVCINERAETIWGGGHAFLMHRDGFSILEEWSGETGIPLPGKKVEKFCLRTPEGRDLQDMQLGSWQCIKRNDLTDFLTSLLGTEVKDHRNFSHFLYDERQKVIAATFSDGTTEYGDVFVGADGAYSKVRTAISGPVVFKPGAVKEVVGVAQEETLAREFAGVFSKFQKQSSGLAFGMIPTSATELVWFMQFDPAVAELPSTTPEALRAFCHQQLITFPAVVQEVLNANDFQKSYLWNTVDFDLLPSFHQNNVVLIGDAAHLALPFTSAGTTNALLDARLLAELLKGVALLQVSDQDVGLAAAFKEFYKRRSPEVLKHLEFGRKLRDRFLNPAAYLGESVDVPLIV